MTNLESFSQESAELKEINWVTNQVKAELQALQQDPFYSKNQDTGQVDYNLTTVKDYLQTLQEMDRKALVSKKSYARIMAVQIALESKGYDVGKVDGIFGAHTRQQVRAFQEANQLTVDGLPGKETIAKLVELLGGEVETGGQKQQASKTNEKPQSSSLETLPQLKLSDLGEWKEGVFIFKKGVEKKDNQGTYIELAGKKFYNNANNGVGYVTASGELLFGEFKDGKANGKGICIRAKGDRYE